MLSGVELYYSENPVKKETISITGDDVKHISRVMRHNIGDTIHITDGRGSIYTTEILSIQKTSIEAKIIKKESYTDDLTHITICLPRLKSADRFEFALEKCVELGFTKFLVFESKYSVAKGSKIERWNKIALAAMKQSLRAFLPKIEYVKKLEHIIRLDGFHYILEQHSEKKLSDLEITKDKSHYFIFGPEGGLSEEELQLIPTERHLQLTQNRLRAETAIITAGAILSKW